MNTPADDRWHELNTHLDRALDLPADERAAWLASLRAENPALAAEVQALLDEARAVADEAFLERSVVPSPIGAATAAVGQRIGAYTLVSPIGHGGMGSVWLAIRSDGRFERRAAVKFLSAALVGRGEERFRREGTVLARLTHPHIAQLFDAGVGPAGQPYLVIEYVDGEPIDRYADRTRLDLDDRVRLFLDVLSAVAHAHANLIVHRDIKPSNVFVDRQGQVKLLDFGIAKLLEAEAGGAAVAGLTRDGAGAMTPEYAAPEQMTGAPVTTATDVYSLGVLLYLLLAGQHPGGQLTSPAEIVRSVVDTEAPPMSAVAAQPKRRRALAGDLDTIVAKALKKNPEERYESATALADDLRRYLRHEPIGARADTLAYRARKFARRNRLPVAAAALTVAGLSLGLFLANRERMVAERRFRQLRQLSTKVFDLDRTIRNFPGSTAARESLVAVSLDYLEGLASDAGGDFDLAQDLADGYWRAARIQGVPVELNLGDFRKADGNLAKADALVETILRSRPRDERALVRSATIAHDRMIIAESERRRTDAVAFARVAADRFDRWLKLNRQSAYDRDQMAGLIGNVALVYLNVHRYTDATTYAQKSLDLARSLSPPARYRVGGALSLLASARRYQGDVDGALAAIREARTLLEANAFADSTSRMIDLYGVLLREGQTLGEESGVNAGRPDEAVAAFQRALDLTEEAARKDPNDSASRSRLVSAARDLGNVLRALDPKRAVAVYDLGIRRAAEVPNNLKARRDLAILLANSSYALRAIGRPVDARQRVERALAIIHDTGDDRANPVDFDGAAFTVPWAAADQQASDGHVADAIAAYDRLLTRIAPDVSASQTDLRDAAKLSKFYQAFAAVCRLAGDAAKADGFVAQRLDLWQHWDHQLPENPFVLRQLASARAD